jgi:lysophospholipase L1-like esterase
VIPRLRVRVIAFCAFWLLLLIIAELTVRLTFRAQLRGNKPDERSLMYAHHPLLGWFPRREGARNFGGGVRTILVRHNSRGFRDREHGAKSGRRVGFLGDSFVWGYDAEQHERFTERLQEQLKDWEVLNFGVSGYGTDQEYLLAQQVIPEYSPDALFLMYSKNDSRDNTTNFRYGAYKPYFRVENGVPRLCGVPVQETLSYRYRRSPRLYKSYLARGVAYLMFRPFEDEVVEIEDPVLDLLGALHGLTQARQIKLAVACVEKYSHLCRYCETHDIPHLDLDDAAQYPERGHWTPEGHKLVAARVAALMRERGWLGKP